MIFEEKTLSSKKIYDGKIINVRLDTVLMPDGKTAARDIVEHPGGVGIVALTGEKEILLVKQFRKPIEKAIYEIPAGKLNKNEDPVECGKRELEEETGFTAKELKYLGFMYPSPGFTDEITHIYFTDSICRGDAHPDEDEFLDIVKVKLDKAIEMIMTNEIGDAKSVFGILKAARILGI